jgi:hypothetical protein
MVGATALTEGQPVIILSIQRVMVIGTMQDRPAKAEVVLLMKNNVKGVHNPLVPYI